MPPLPHRIRRLTLRVRATSPEQALALRKEVRDQLDTVLLAALERAFDGAGAQDELIQLPKVHVQVRISGADTLTEELAKRIEEELHRQLVAAAPGQAGPAASSGATGRPGVAGLAPSGTDTPMGESPASRQSRVQMLFHYLETGSLPWPLARVDTPLALSELREVAVTDAPGAAGQLTGEPVLLTARVAFWFRWLQLLPDARWPVLARAAAPASSGQGAWLAELVGALTGEQAGTLSRYARLQLAAAAIAWSRGTGGSADVGELASLVVQVLGGGPGGLDWTERLSGGTGHPASGALDGGGGNDRVARPGRSEGGVPGGGASGAGAASGSRSPERPSRGTASHGAGASGGAGQADRTSPGGRGATEEARLRAATGLAARLPGPAAAAFRDWLSPEPPALPQTGAPGAGTARGAPAEPGQPLQPGLAAVMREARSRDSDARPAPFGQMVHHAGLVLLHPFLSRFFESTGVKKAGQPALASEALPRAAALLHLLATGEEEAFELELDFIKVLLGLPLDASLPVSEGLLLASDREEVEALLSAVIGYWSVLKSTSVKGLRGSFLQRPGLLREEAQGFRLQVEPAPFDMLLGQLPWGIGTVKLPWMRKAIFTEWPAP